MKRVWKEAQALATFAGIKTFDRFSLCEKFASFDQNGVRIVDIPLSRLKDPTLCEYVRIVVGVEDSGCDEHFRCGKYLDHPIPEDARSLLSLREEDERSDFMAYLFDHAHVVGFTGTGNPWFQEVMTSEAPALIPPPLYEKRVLEAWVSKCAAVVPTWEVMWFTHALGVRVTVTRKCASVSFGPGLVSICDSIAKLLEAFPLLSEMNQHGWTLEYEKESK